MIEYVAAPPFIIAFKFLLPIFPSIVSLVLCRMRMRLSANSEFSGMRPVEVVVTYTHCLGQASSPAFFNVDGSRSTVDEGMTFVLTTYLMMSVRAAAGPSVSEKVWMVFALESATCFRQPLSVEPCRGG